jgi:hypothetical protein
MVVIKRFEVKRETTKRGVDVLRITHGRRRVKTITLRKGMSDKEAKDVLRKEGYEVVALNDGQRIFVEDEHEPQGVRIPRN